MQHSMANLNQSRYSASSVTARGRMRATSKVRRFTHKLRPPQGWLKRRWLDACSAFSGAMSEVRPILQPISLSPKREFNVIAYLSSAGRSISLYDQPTLIESRPDGLYGVIESTGNGEIIATLRPSMSEQCFYCDAGGSSKAIRHGSSAELQGAEFQLSSSSVDLWKSSNQGEHNVS